MANITRYTQPTFGGISMFDDFDRLMDNVLGNMRLTVQPSGQRSSGSLFNPHLDISETETGVQVTAELPGLEAADVNLDITDNILTLKGEKKSQTEDKSTEKGMTFYRQERTYGSFTRRIALPTEVDADKVEATFKNGILSISLPKTEKSQPKPIAIKTN